MPSRKVPLGFSASLSHLDGTRIQQCVCPVPEAQGPDAAPATLDGSSSHSRRRVLAVDKCPSSRQLSIGNTSTLASSESGGSSVSRRGSEAPAATDFVYGVQKGTNGSFGWHGSCDDRPYIEDGYYAVDPRAHSGFVHHQPPPPPTAAAAAAYDGYYHASQMYSGVYYSVASPPAIDGNSPYGECSPYSMGCGPTPTVTYGHPPQFFYPDAGPQHPGMVQPHQQPCPPMPAAAQPTYTGFAYHHQRRDSVFSEGANRYCPSFNEQQQQQVSGVCTMRSDLRQQACHAARIPPSPQPGPPFAIHCSTRQPPLRSTADHQEGYHHTLYRGSWDYGYAEMEVPARHGHGNPPGGGIPYQARPYYGEYASQGYGHMTTYHPAGMPLDGPSRAYAITRGGYSPSGGVVPQSDAPLTNTMPGAYGDTWSSRTYVRGGGG
ncbi:hypothetical protein FOL46_006372 [Perkinsus olseni]|uniref:Uncharacterized protein n=1 Tax=Perkinsus olseni TaxID=32597 RepID=A0A7J6LM06_PEROL|nr:hypothetical protein FOL46_006372 [Perkinsus olseni]